MNDVALVTGANKGIGKEIARRLVASGMTVYLGARDERRGQAAAEEVGGRFVRLDVTDPAQAEAAAKRVEEDFGRLDVLVNNAGISVAGQAPAREVSADVMRQVYEVNVFGVVTVIRAFLPLLARAENARVVNMSSQLGSLGRRADPAHLVSGAGFFTYSSSKTALNAITLIYANELREAGIKVNVVNPGYVATDLNGHSGHLTVEEGAEAPVRLALAEPGGPTGAFVELVDGELHPIPW